MYLDQVARVAESVCQDVAEHVNASDTNEAETVLGSAKTGLVAVAALVGAVGGVALASAATSAYMKSSEPAESEAPRISEGEHPAHSEAEVETVAITPRAVQQSKIQESRSGVFMANHAKADIVRAESVVNKALIAEHTAAHIAYGKEVIANLKASA